MECTLIRSADGTKLAQATGMWEGSAAIQRDLDSLEERVNKKLIKFRKIRCKSLYLGRKSPLQQIQAVSWLAGKWLCRKTPGALADSKLNTS